MVDDLVQNMNQLNETIQTIIYQLNQQNINQLRDEFNETIYIMQQNIASNDLTLKFINETVQYGRSYGE